MRTVAEVAGEVKNFQFHTDQHADKNILAGGCGHWKQINLDPEAFDLKKEQIKEIGAVLADFKKQGAKQTVLTGEHREGAVVQVKGNYSVYPRSMLKTEEGSVETEIFIYHASLVDERHRLMAKKLLDNNAVKLFPGCDAEYLYQVLSDEGEKHLFEILKRLATGLPIYSVEFDEDGGFTFQEMGKMV